MSLRDESGPVTVCIAPAFLLIFCFLQWLFNKLAKHTSEMVATSDAEINGRNLRDILTSFYQIHNPDRVGEVDKIINKYAGHEEQLFVNLAKKYNVDLKQVKTAALELPAKRSGPQLDKGMADNEQAALKLQEEERLKREDEKLAAELQEEDEKERMLSTNDGCAFLFVQNVLKVCQGLKDVLGDKDILPVSEDDMVYMTKRLLELRDTFQAKGKDVTVDVGYHYTSSSALKHIQQDGLMTHSDRLSNKKLQPQEAEPSHALLFGDGVYTGNYPAEFTKYGKVGILVARLQGKRHRVEPDDVMLGGTLKNYSIRLNKADTLGQAAISAGYDTVVGNKSVGRQPYYRLDEIVLLRSSQCIPLVHFPSSLVKYYHTEVPEPIKHYLDAMEKAINTYLNQPMKKTLSSQLTTSIKPFQVGVMPSPAKPSPAKKRSKQRPKKTQPTTPIILPLVSVKEEVIRYKAPDHLPLPDLSQLLSPMVWVAADKCIICLDALGNDASLLLQTKCNHMYHKICLQTALQYDHKCPSCQTLGIVKPHGKCPSGTMKVSINKDNSCEGYEDFGSIEIKYVIYEGTQKDYHEKVGEPFDATTRQAYLPNNRNGHYLVRRLKFAFRHGLIFRVGTSLTTNKEESIVLLFDRLQTIYTNKSYNHLSFIIKIPGSCDVGINSSQD